MIKYAFYSLGLAAIGAAPFVVPPPFSGINSGTVSACANDAVVYDSNGVQGCAYTTNTAPQNVILHAQDNYPGGSQTAADTRIRGGIDEKTIAIDAFANCAGDNVGIIIDGTTNTLTEGVTWTAATSNAATCTSLASAVNALTGVSATCSTSTVLITPDLTLASLSLTESDASCTTVANGTDGHVRLFGFLSGNAAAGPWMRDTTASGTVPTMGPTRADTTMGIGTSASRISIITGSVARLEIYSGDAIFSSGVVIKARAGIQNDTGSLTVSDDLVVNNTFIATGSVVDVGTTCTVGQWFQDEGGATDEICICTATNTIRCVATTTTNPAD